MGANTGIEWADATFNPWWGCQRVSEACRNCYAERFARRQRVQWGPTAERRIASERTWAQPLAWNRAAVRKHQRRRVFCASMGDVFEDRPELAAPRSRLWALIGDTLMLDWLLLTKHPQNIVDMVPPHWLSDPQRNVWLGTTAETQVDADRRIPALLQTPAVVHFVSCEPLLEAVDLRRYLEPGAACSCPAGAATSRCNGSWIRCNAGMRTLKWVIAGGESGHRARPVDVDWVRSLRDQCSERDSAVPFFFKQWGDWLPAGQKMRPGAVMRSSDLIKLGKKRTGRTLDGLQWQQLPKQAHLFAA